MSRGRRKDTKDDDDTELSIKGLKQYDGSQGALHVHRIMARLERAFVYEIEIDAYKVEKWKVECTEEFITKNFRPSKVLPKLRPKSRTETVEAYNIRVHAHREATRSIKADLIASQDQ